MSVGLETPENLGPFLKGTIHCRSIHDQSFSLGKINENVALPSKGMSLNF